MSRIERAKKNIIFGYVGNIVLLLMQFLSRTIFISFLGVAYLGVNGLYTNVLSVLSLADLGIATAMNYSLYKPVAAQDVHMIKKLMQYYRKAYLYIALAIAVLGLAIVPFISLIVKNPGTITTSELTIYYLIFLFNTVTSYFVAYKYSLINAEQKNYIQTNIHTLTTVITVVSQIIVLFVYKSFLAFLIIGAVIGLFQKIFVNLYLNKLYPYLLEKNIDSLTEKEKEPIRSNIKALIYHKIGTISIYQTDNIVISTFINVATVGLISNYNMIMASVNGFINILFNSVISGFGNLIASESIDRQYLVFKAYRFLGFWVYGFSTIAFYVLINPFIELWIGKEMLISQAVVILILINYYFMGQRIVVGNFKTAAGIFEDDKYIAIIQAIVNLVISVILVQSMGLIGVYIGTIVSGLISTLSKPFIVYRRAFNRSGIDYYKDSAVYLLAIMIAIALIQIVQVSFFSQVNWFNFIILMGLVVLVPNLLFLAAFNKRDEFTYLYEIFGRKMLGRIKS
ncbi:MAG: polysaccharide biosynthesis protein [Firmicutes bacterium HGW-Firmicutes-19]|nr:MAG: polysaccharide biosynthesis protein [Firmicutes bacterium HGW-Firmicutes-19]